MNHRPVSTYKGYAAVGTEADLRLVNVDEDTWMS